jgi:CheY-like chemotaxis protein
MNSEPSNANADRPATSVLFIDASKTERNYWADQLKRCSADYEILEASDGKEGIAICQSRRIDCVVLELSLSGESGLKTLMQLVPIARKPQMAVVVLTVQTQPGIWELAKQNGAYTCLAKRFTAGEHLDISIQRAIAFVEQMPKEDRHRPL